MNRRYLLALIVLLVLTGCSVGRGCRPDAPPPTPTIPPPPTIAATMTPTAENPAPVTRTPIAPIETPESATATPTAELTPTVEAAATPVPTPALLGYHAVVSGDTMFDIGLWWYRGRFFAWGVDVWRPICMANPEITDCRLIYPGDVLRIPVLP